MIIFKASLLVIYIAALISFFVPALAPYSSTLVIISALVLAFHVIEYIAVVKKLSAKGHSGIGPFIQTLLFGLLYWKPLLSK